MKPVIVELYRQQIVSFTTIWVESNNKIRPYLVLPISYVPLSKVTNLHKVVA